jgi:acetolactate synthase-1/2/3 large subunit
MSTLRGADIVVRTLGRAGVQHVFSLSGNHVMALYDAALDSGLDIVHTRHEGAAVHMADAWGRLTGDPGVALLTGGPGHANGLGALYTAAASESPLVMLSGHAPLSELGKGSFQEMRQADMAAPVVKAAWTAREARTLGEDIAQALRIAASGRPGPVHVSLPVDLLEARIASSNERTAPRADGATDTESSSLRAAPRALSAAAADTVLALLGKAARPLVLTGPVMSNGRAGEVREALARALGVPVLCMESPRGLNDPALGALAEIVARADFIVLLGKQPDFTLRFARPPAIGAACRIAVIDPEAHALERALEMIGAERVVLAAIADSVASARVLAECVRTRCEHADWVGEVEAAVGYRPPEWATIDSGDGPVHPAEVGRSVQRILEGCTDAVFVSDGGEFGQWAQACIDAPTRIINGQGGSIGSAIPFALAAKLARPGAAVIATTGDGACGFHLLELETAVRAGLAPVIVVGNDACWNAEHQIQIRAYGRERARYTELLPARYDAVAAALGAHGELVTRAADLGAALERAIRSGKPALVNVIIQRQAAPTVQRAERSVKESNVKGENP